MLGPGLTGVGRLVSACLARSSGWGEDEQVGFPRDQEDRRMSDSRTKGRRSSSRAFRPTLDGQLEDRVLLSNSQGRAYFALSQHLLGLTNGQPQAKAAN